MTSEPSTKQEQHYQSLATEHPDEWRHVGAFIIALDACRAELAAATAREAKLRDALTALLAGCDQFWWAWSDDTATGLSIRAMCHEMRETIQSTRALLAEPDTTSGEE